MSWLSRKIKNIRAKMYSDRIKKVLCVSKPWDTRKSEEDFDSLLLQYSDVEFGKYGYDFYSLMCRAVERVGFLEEKSVIKKESQKILELGCGDGVTGWLLRECGSEVFLTDMADWRMNCGREMPFIETDICSMVDVSPLGEEYDLILSYNSMEHFPQPERIFPRLGSLLKKGGMFYFDFCPLYGAWNGLHIYRSIPIPYPQFLFSPHFLEKKLAGKTIYDLGKEREAPQHVNGWLPKQYDQLWNHPDYEIVFIDRWADWRHVDVILRYPEAFQGRGLCLEDLTYSRYRVLLRKK